MKPTCEELMDEELESVKRTSDDSWRHGSYITEVFHRDSDNTFWRAMYEQSTDGESNGLREGTADIVQVWPKEVTTITYVTEKP